MHFLNAFLKVHVEMLRTGFTTGACAAAAARSSVSSLFHNKEIKNEMIFFPDGCNRFIPIHSVRFLNNGVVATVVKDAGDDPDVTNGAFISSFAQVIDTGLWKESDFVKPIKKGHLVIRGGTGIGFVTRDGLPVEKGKPAVNPIPREMIWNNINDLLPSSWSKTLLIELSVKNGALIAKKTLNERLGIVGGISILGTSGIVTPYSNDAYIETVRMLLQCAFKDGVREIILVTGNQTEKAMSKIFSPFQIIRIGDFIFDAINISSKCGFKTVHLAVMPGKLFKISCGYKNTHAAKNSLTLDKAASMIPSKIYLKIRHCVTVRESLMKLDTSEQIEFLKSMEYQAQKVLASWFPNLSIIIHPVVFEGECG